MGEGLGVVFILPLKLDAELAVPRGACDTEKVTYLTLLYQIARSCRLKHNS